MLEHNRYLKTILTHQNYMHEKIKNRLQLEKACYLSFQNRFFSSLLSKNMQFKTHKSYNFACFVWILN